MILVDSHAHLGQVAERLGREALDRVLGEYAAAAEAARAGGRTPPLLLDPGLEPGDLAERAALAAGRPFLRLAAGIWPSRAALADPRGGLEFLERSIAGSPAPVAAVGEAGLDFFHMEGSPAAQLELFAGQAAIAQRLGLPLVVHSRDAAAATVEAIGAARLSVPVVVHCFGYGPAEVRDFLDLGCWISFAGNLTYPKAGALREACALVPEDRLLLETDAPYMNPEPRRGRPSTPLDVERTYAEAARLRGRDPEALSEAIARTAALLFG